MAPVVPAICVGMVGAVRRIRFACSIVGVVEPTSPSAKALPCGNRAYLKTKPVSVLEHIADGCGVRQTARLVKVHRDTVGRLNRQAGAHAVRTHEEVVPISPPDRRDTV